MHKIRGVHSAVVIGAPPAAGGIDQQQSRDVHTDKLVAIAPQQEHVEGLDFPILLKVATDMLRWMRGTAGLGVWAVWWWWEGRGR